jgi:hypothetical protein
MLGPMFKKFSESTLLLESRVKSLCKQVKCSFYTPKIFIKKKIQIYPQLKTKFKKTKAR